MIKFKEKTKDELEVRAKVLNENAHLWDKGDLGESEDNAIVHKKTSPNSRKEPQ